MLKKDVKFPGTDRYNVTIYRYTHIRDTDTQTYIYVCMCVCVCVCVYKPMLMYLNVFSY